MSGTANLSNLTDGDDTEEYVCDLSDLPIGRPVQAVVSGVVMAVVRVADREVYAVNDVCTHANVSLSEGDLIGCQLECWMHGSRFDLRTGVPSGPPAIVPVAVYPVRLDGDDVYISTTPTNQTPAAPTQENPS